MDWLGHTVLCKKDVGKKIEGKEKKGAKAEFSENILSSRKGKKGTSSLVVKREGDPGRCERKTCLLKKGNGCHTENSTEQTEGKSLRGGKEEDKKVRRRSQKLKRRKSKQRLRLGPIRKVEHSGWGG